MPEVPCEVRRTTGTQEEARVFVELQEKRRRITSYQRFQAKLLYNDPDAKVIADLIGKHRFAVLTGAGAGTWLKDDTIGSIGVLERIHRAHGAKGVDNVLYVMRKAWNGEATSTSKLVMNALSRVFEVTPRMNRERFAEAIGEKDLYGLIDKAARFGHANSISHTEALAEVFKELA
jgi:hypothetical protein